MTTFEVGVMSALLLDFVRGGELAESFGEDGRVDGRRDILRKKKTEK